MSHPPWPPPTPVTALVPGKTQVLGWSVCVSGLLRLSAVGCRCRLPLSAGQAVGEKLEEEKVLATPGGMSWRPQAPDGLLE